jgi:sulfide dehydrogenase [flavocytochrome c] flavoprotein chain
MKTSLQRRSLLTASGAGAALAALGGCAGFGESAPPKPVGRVVVIGGGWGGMTAAKYLRVFSGGAIQVFLIEREASFVSCPLSNLVLSGQRKIEDLTHGYASLRNHGVQVVRANVTAINVERKRVVTDRIEDMPYDRVIVSPGIDFIPNSIEGLDAEAQKTILHAWKAGPDTTALRRQLEAMPDGGVYVLAIPRAPYRCPPGPYERVCQVAQYVKTSKPKSKVIVLDANEQIVSKPGLFRAAWDNFFKGIIEYRNNAEVRRVDAKAMTVSTDFDTIKGNVLNVLPPQRAADLARTAGLVTANDRWCGVDWLTMESTARKEVHVLGDSTLSAPAMPKSGHMANQHGKVAAAAITAIMTGRPVNENPVIANTCYSFTSDRHAVHVASVHRFDPAQKTMVAVAGSGGVSSENNELEHTYAQAWARNVWADMMG